MPIHFAFSYDEEIGCLGAHSLAERMVGDVPRPRAVIIGEPTMMTRGPRAQGRADLRHQFTGFEAHSSMTHLGVSAIHFAGDFIHWLNELQVELDGQAPKTSTPCRPQPPSMSAPSIGGTAGNILARECTLNWGYRTLPGETPRCAGQRAPSNSSQN